MNKKSRILMSIGAFLVITPLLVFCTPSAEPSAQVYRVSSRSQLIGGPRALGEIGDYLLENDQIRVVVQDKGFSRGFGIYGGSIIDADLVRTRSGEGDSASSVGYDNFGEMFPAFFLEAMSPIVLRLLVTRAMTRRKLRRKKPVVIQIMERWLTRSRYGSDFLAMTESINDSL